MSINSVGALVVRFWSLNGDPRMTGIGARSGHPSILEEDRGKRFALWSFLHMFGSAPDLDVAFENEEDRDAARNFRDLLAASEGKGEA